MSLSDVTATATNKGDISVLITGADGKRVQAEIQGMGTFSPGTDANGPSFWPRGSSDVRSALPFLE